MFQIDVVKDWPMFNPAMNSEKVITSLLKKKKVSSVEREMLMQVVELRAQCVDFKVLQANLGNLMRQCPEFSVFYLKQIRHSKPQHFFE